LIQVVVGPRQVGKTTAIRGALAGRGVYETADMPVPLRSENIQEWWAAAQRTPERLLAIDEVQKISGWSEAVKRLWDLQTPPRTKLTLSGSAALAIERDLIESLAGRYELIRAEHWNFLESRAAFGLNLRQFIEHGCYPGSMSLIHDVPRWAEYIRESIVGPVIGRDILQLHPVQSPALLRQVFAAAVGLPAQIVSLSTLQGSLQDRGALATLQHYIELLGHGFMVSALQKYSRASIRSRRSPPKLIVHDNGLLRAFERPPSSPLGPEKMGRYFENAVAARFVEAGWEVFYWRDRDLEVDLVVRGPNGEDLAIEVKSAAASSADLKGLRTFCAKDPQFEPCLVSMVDQQLPDTRTLSIESVLSLSRTHPQLR
jgi:predicted AAA+ superfamily ATPase